MISSVFALPDLEESAAGSSNSGLPRGSPQFCHVELGRKAGLVGRVAYVEGLKTSREPRVFLDDGLFGAWSVGSISA